MAEVAPLDSGQRLPGVADDTFTVTDDDGRRLGWVVRHPETSARAAWSAITDDGRTIGRGMARRHQAVAALEEP